MSTFAEYFEDLSPLTERAKLEVTCIHLPLHGSLPIPSFALAFIGKLDHELFLEWGRGKERQ